VLVVAAVGEPAEGDSALENKAEHGLLHDDDDSAASIAAAAISNDPFEVQSVAAMVACPVVVHQEVQYSLFSEGTVSCVHQCLPSVSAAQNWCNDLRNVQGGTAARYLQGAHAA